MLLEQLLLEDRADFIAQQMGPKLVARLQQDTRQRAEPRAILDQLLAADPTRNQQYIQWIAKQYVAGGFKMEDLPRIKGELVNFDRVKPKLANKDLNSYKTLPDLYSALEPFADQEVVTNKEEDRRLSAEMYKQATVLYKGTDYTLLSPKTEAASCFFGRGTKWCTAATENNMFKQYTGEAPLIILMDRAGKKYQFHFPTPDVLDYEDQDEDQDEGDNTYDNDDDEDSSYGASVMDSEDQTVKLSVLFKQYPNLQKLLMDHTGFAEWTDPNNKLAQSWYIRSVGIKPVLTDSHAKAVQRRNAEAPAKLLSILTSDQSSGGAVQDALKAYAKLTGNGRWPEAESHIAADAGMALDYAIDVIKGRWPEGERAIGSYPSTALEYAMKVVKGRWPEGEPSIATNGSDAGTYALKVLKKRWPEMEDKIKHGTFRYIWREYAAKFGIPE